MKTITKYSVLAVALFVFSVFPAYAHGQGNSGDHSNRPESTRQNVSQERKQAAQERVSDIKQRVEERRAEVKQRVCERRQERLQQLIPRLASGATNVLGAFDAVYERVQGFYESEQLSVENYETLKANIDSAQSEAATSVEAAQEFKFELDCEEPGIGQQLDGFRTAVNEARDDLKVYRTELVSLISAMRSSEAIQNTENDTADTDEDDSQEENGDEESEQEEKEAEEESEQNDDQTNEDEEV